MPAYGAKRRHLNVRLSAAPGGGIVLRKAGRIFSAQRLLPGSGGWRRPMRRRNFEFLPLDGVQLSEALKPLPQIVYDFDCLAARSAQDDNCRELISSARHEEAGESTVGASIKLAQSYRDTDRVNNDYLAEMQRELEAIGPRMDQRRQAAMGALAVVRRLDLVPAPNRLSGMRGIGLHKLREMLRFVAAEWGSIVEGLGGEDAAFDRLGVPRDDFFEVFGNNLNTSPAMSTLALRLIESSPTGAPTAAIRFAEGIVGAACRLPILDGDGDADY
jgi:hypothetical protein